MNERLYSIWNHQKTLGFLKISGGVKVSKSSFILLNLCNIRSESWNEPCAKLGSEKMYYVTSFMLLHRQMPFQSMQ